VENPAASYLWQYVQDLCAETPFEDVVFTPCLWGAEFKKPTRLRCWGWRPSELDARCGHDGKDCGKQHVTLEFGGGGSTAQAAAYHPKVCETWAAAVATHLADTSAAAARDQDARDTVEVFDEGRVKRHGFRGEDVDSKRERKQKEDAEALAGCRNPAKLHEKWPALWAELAPVGAILAKAVQSQPDL